MSFCKNKVAKLRRRAEGTASSFVVMLSGREPDGDGDGRSIFHPRVETA
jgi:hypothetical protein